MRQFRRHVLIGHGKKKVRYKATTATMPTMVRHSGCAHAGNYIMLAGGYWQSTTADTFQVCDNNFVTSSPRTLPTPKDYIGASQNSTYAIFYGGYHWNTTKQSAFLYGQIWTVDSALVWQDLPYAYPAKGPVGAVNEDNKVFFGGGVSSEGEDSASYSNDVLMLDTNLAQSHVQTLDIKRYGLSAACVNNHVLFAGGIGSNGSRSLYNTVESYDTNGTMTLITGLSVARGLMGSASLRDYALFAGGGYYNTYTYGTVDAYDRNLTRVPVTPLAVARTRIASTELGNKEVALFAGGGDLNNYWDCVDSYDNFLVRTTENPLKSKKYDCSAGTVNGIAMVLCGSGNYVTYEIDAYEYK